MLTVIKELPTLLHWFLIWTPGRHCFEIWTQECNVTVIKALVTLLHCFEIWTPEKHCFETCTQKSNVNSDQGIAYLASLFWNLNSRKALFWNLYSEEQCLQWSKNCLPCSTVLKSELQESTVLKPVLWKARLTGIKELLTSIVASSVSIKDDRPKNFASSNTPE